MLAFDFEQRDLNSSLIPFRGMPHFLEHKFVLNMKRPAPPFQTKQPLFNCSIWINPPQISAEQTSHLVDVLGGDREGGANTTTIAPKTIASSIHPSNLKKLRAILPGLM